MKKIQLYRKQGNGRYGIYIPLNEYAIIDNDDESKVMGVTHHWLKHSQGYAYTNIKSRGLLMHRFILDLTDPKIHTDHLDHNRLNNQKNNLKACTQQENNQNAIFKGVGKYKNKWRAWTPGTFEHLGVFNTKQAAKDALLLWYQTKQKPYVTPSKAPVTIVSSCCNAKMVRHGKCSITYKQRYQCTICRKVSQNVTG